MAVTLEELEAQALKLSVSEKRGDKSERLLFVIDPFWSLIPPRTSVNLRSGASLTPTLCAQ